MTAPRAIALVLTGWAALAVYTAACAVDWVRTRGRSVDGIPTERNR